MTKRKKGIFTVAEAVTNWFEASEPTETNTGREENVDNWTGSDSYMASQSNVAPEPSNWVDNSVGEEARAEVFPEGFDHIQTGEPTDQLGVSQRETTQVVHRLEAGCRYEGGLSVTQRAPDAPVTARSEGYPVIDTLPGNAEVVIEGNLTHAVFWQLLKDAGYDTW